MNVSPTVVPGRQDYVLLGRYDRIRTGQFWCSNNLSNGNIYIDDSVLNRSPARAEDRGWRSVGSGESIPMDPTTIRRRSGRAVRRTPRWVVFVTGCVALGSLGLAEPALAQSSGVAFCDTELAETIRNIFTVIQFAGPLIGGVVALAATVALAMTRRVDLKTELKELRNQAIIWGVIVTPLSTIILTFILDNVVAGGASCGF